MSVEAKICGLKSKEAVDAAVQGGAAYLGFVFFERSPRNITPQQAAEISAGVEAKKMVVLVDPTDEQLDSILASFTPDYLQLHGSEMVQRVEEIKKKYNIPVMKALKIASADDVAAAHAYGDVVDMFLFDAQPPENLPSALPGGNGLAFDWHLLQSRQFSKPWMLSGGLNSDNVEEAVRLTGAQIVDVSSSLENEPGVKDPALITAFLEKVKSI